ncbi:adenine phosphoribosyltransferase [bacterium]|nr:adenine phosphoribosyltransferase [bacterium]
MHEIKALIRDIPDFPKNGIIFKDITPVLQDPKAFKKVIDLFRERYVNQNIQKIAAIESRGFIFGAPLAYALNIGFVVLRKPGKLPYRTFREEYELEYGTDAIEIHQDAFEHGERVVLIDDLLATGGTALAAANLLQKAGAELVELAFLIELSFLNGRAKLTDHNVFSFVSF